MEPSLKEYHVTKEAPLIGRMVLLPGRQATKVEILTIYVTQLNTLDDTELITV